MQRRVRQVRRRQVRRARRIGWGGGVTRTPPSPLLKILRVLPHRRGILVKQVLAPASDRGAPRGGALPWVVGLLALPYRCAGTRGDGLR